MQGWCMKRIWKIDHSIHTSGQPFELVRREFVEFESKIGSYHVT